MVNIYDILFFLVLFLIVFVVNYLSSIRKIKKHKTNKIELLNYLIRRFRLDKTKIKPFKIILVISLINAFIISFVTTFITILDISFLWQIMIGFVLLFGLIYSLYEIYGRYLVKKYGVERRKK